MNCNWETRCYASTLHLYIEYAVHYLIGFEISSMSEKRREGCSGMPKPVVDKEKCIGCGTCVSVCPQGVLELKDDKAEVVKPEECIGCRSCEAACPEGAITVVEE